MTRRALLIAVVFCTVASFTLFGGSVAQAENDQVDPDHPTLVTLGTKKTSNWFFVYQGKRQWLSPQCSQDLGATHTPEVLRWRDISSLNPAPGTRTCAEIGSLLTGTQPAPYELVTNSSRNSAGWIIGVASRQWLTPTCRAQLEAAGFAFAVTPFQGFGSRARVATPVACTDIPALLGSDTPETSYPERCADVTTIPQVQCEALVALYQSTGGPNWTVSAGWLTGSDPCDWYAVRCIDGHVWTIEIYQDNNMVGQLPTEIGDLTDMVAMIIANNPGLAGPLPASLASLAGLADTLNLSGNGFTGPIPPGLGNLDLIFADLSGNNLEGTIPSDLGNLFFLDLSGNLLTGEIPSSFPTGTLVGLNLAGNCVDDSAPGIQSWLPELRSYAGGINC